MDLSQLTQKFIDEAHELLNSLDSILLDLEKNTQDEECIRKIFRVMHTIKGSSGMWGLTEITEITHSIESLYDLIGNNKITVNENIIHVTFETADIIRLLLNKDKAPHENDYDKICRQLCEKINRITNIPEFKINSTVPKKSRSPENIIRSWLIIFTPDDSLITRGINLLFTFHDLFQLGKYEITTGFESNETEQWNILLVTDNPRDVIDDVLCFVLDNFKITLIADFDILAEKELENRDKLISKKCLRNKNEEQDGPDIKIEYKPDQFSGIKQKTSKISIDSSKLDTLMYLISELVISKSELLLSLESNDTEKSKAIAETIDMLSRLFQDNALSLRLVSLKDLFSMYKRLVRDLSKQLNKKVQLEIHGEDTELDKNIIEALSEPMIHLIRNCIDHGLETPEKRKAMGKSEQGIIKLNAYKKGNYVFVQVCDDGVGIDKEKILSKAVSKNIISENQQLTDKEIYDLIFIPGFSTAESLTQVSGRGIGMDIVRNKILEIRGEINVDSEKGKGTCFTLKLQQSIAIIDTLLTRVAGSIFAIPLEDIESCQQLDTNKMLQGQNKLIVYKDSLIPFISIHDELRNESKIPEEQKAIIINKAEKCFAIVVEEIIGEFQAVIKPLDKLLNNIKFISGASILGDGNIALLIDTENIKSLI